MIRGIQMFRITMIAALFSLPHNPAFATYTNVSPLDFGNHSCDQEGLKLNKTKRITLRIVARKEDSETGKYKLTSLQNFESWAYKNTDDCGKLQEICEQFKKDLKKAPFYRFNITEKIADFENGVPDVGFHCSHQGTLYNTWTRLF